MRRMLTTVSLSLISCFGAAISNAQDAESGADLYFVFCAGCHGVEARGEGEIAKILTVAPPDLTQLSAGNDGVFPLERAARRIDGRDPFAAHGGPMPLFGTYLQDPVISMKTEAGQPILLGQGLADLLAFLQDYTRVSARPFR